MDNRRLILLMIFSISLVMLWDAWQKYNQPKAPVQATAAQSGTATPQPTTSLQAAAPTAAPAAPAGAAAPAATTETITVKTDLFTADISTLGGDITRLELSRYTATEDKRRTFALFEPKHRYAAQSGLIGDGMPNHRTQFTAVKGPRELAKDGGKDDKLQVRLEATAANGVKVAKVYTFSRGSYAIDVATEVLNGGAQPLTAHAYYQFQRDDVAPEGESAMVSTFTGPAVFTGEEKYQKLAFDDIAKDKAKFAKSADNGWLAMVQHYFVAAWVPQGKDKREFYARKLEGGNGSPLLTAAGLILPLPQIAPGAAGQQSITLYAGPQEQATLKKLAEGLDLVVDYGWLTVIAAPIFWVLQAIHGLVGNWGWAIVLLTVGIKAIFYPLSAASYKSMAKMRTITPRLMQLKERFGDDRQRLNQEMMKLYQTEKINPLGGCLPILVQIPVFIALYWVLLGAVEMRDAPWALWITDLSSADPYYVLPVIMVVSMIIQTKLNPTPPDPIQAKVMMAMPFIFGVMFFWFPSGLVLYWVVNNILSIAQQWQITRMIEGGGKQAA
ncbi:membrane protein insertase YidC [Azospira restricta]|uniref:Membrane protein insertase YidC n=1 Tax=Azospira restricta TaxID=404405 RepID=A0A974SQ75_9RHOO|nr:membrane protein insertase YidC [Azospira restricta]QRJ64363.1 membrane protein insertase YidC [Azospira restricta]